MSHFLTNDEGRGARAIGKPWAFVQVSFERGASAAKSRLVPEPDLLSIHKADTLVVDLPGYWKVRDPEGKIVKPPKGRKFVVTVETIDPHHLIAEVDGEPRR